MITLVWDVVRILSNPPIHPSSTAPHLGSRTGAVRHPNQASWRDCRLVYPLYILLMARQPYVKANIYEHTQTYP